MSPHERARRIITELQQLVPADQRSTLKAANLAAEEQRQAHYRYHANAIKIGATVWQMREDGMSWREIYHATGIIQRNGDRWMKLFLAEETVPSEVELDRRHDGEAEA